MKGGGGRPLSPRRGLGNGHGGLRGGSPAGAVLCAQHLGILLSPCPPRMLRLPKVTGPGRTPSFRDPSAVGMGGVTRSSGDKRGLPMPEQPALGESRGILGSPVQPCAAQTGGIIRFLR